MGVGFTGVQLPAGAKTETSNDRAQRRAGSLHHTGTT